MNPVCYLMGATVVALRRYSTPCDPVRLAPDVLRPAIRFAPDVT